MLVQPNTCLENCSSYKSLQRSLLVVLNSKKGHRIPLLYPSMGKWPLGREGWHGSLQFLRVSPWRGTVCPAEWLLLWEGVNGMFVSPGVRIKQNKTAAVSAQCIPSRSETLPLVVLSGCGVMYKKFAWSHGGRNKEMCALTIGCAVTQPASDQHSLWLTQFLSVWSHIICSIMF